MIKRIVQGGGAFLVLGLGVILLRTFLYTGSTEQSGFIILPDVPIMGQQDVGQAAERLGAAIRFQTVARKAGDPVAGADQPWLDLHDFIEQTYADFLSKTTRQTIGKYTLVYKWPGRDATLAPIVLMAHQDVVPYNDGTLEDWAYGPFAGKVADGYIWGRGAMDNKGTLIALLEGASALAKTGWTPERTIIFLFGHDEEVLGAGAKAAFAELGRQNITPMMVLDEGMMALESFPLTGKPVGLVGIAEKGYLSVRITARTMGGHSSAPPRESGAVRIARVIVALEENQMPANLEVAPFIDMVGAVASDLPFMTRMAFANRWIFSGMIKAQAGQEATSNALLRTTTAPTMMNGSAKDNVLPQRASAVVNFRVHPSNTPEQVLAHVREVTAGIEGLEILALDGGGGAASPVSSTDSKAYQVLASIARELGEDGPLPVAPALVIGATDSRFAAMVMEDGIYRFAPALLSAEDLAGFHGTNERLLVANLERMMRGYMQIMVALAGS